MNKKKLTIIIVVLCVVLLAALAVCISLIVGSNGEDANTTAAVSDTVETTESATDSNDTDGTANTSAEPSVTDSGSVTDSETVAETTSDGASTEVSTDSNTTASPETDIVQEIVPIAVANGIQLMKLSSADGKFPEDGSGDDVKGVMTATICNGTVKTLQYAKLVVACGGEEYTFEITTIPSGESVIAFETSRKPAPSQLNGELTMTPVYTVFFENEPTMESDKLEITVEDGSLKVKNISDEPIERDFSVYYKNTNGDVYMGGITYRVRITDTILPGETLTGYASHASEGESVIMFVQYDS